MKPPPRVRDYMSRNLVTLAPATEINRAMQVLIDHRISGAPVVDASGRLIGVLSKKDCLRAALHASYHRDWSGSVESYMTVAPETLEPHLDIVTAAEHFVAGRFRRYPVVEEGRLVGQISRADVLRALSDHWGG